MLKTNWWLLETGRTSISPLYYVLARPVSKTGVQVHHVLTQGTEGIKAIEGMFVSTER